jgi:hypothetical protein
MVMVAGTALLGGGACGGGATTEPAIAGVRRIVSLSRAGSLDCPGGASFSFNDGEFYADLRAALLDPASFGPEGRVPVTLALRPSIDLVRTGALGRADILVVNRPRGTSLDDLALDALRQFVAGGGALLSLGDVRQTFLGAPGDCAADAVASVDDSGPEAAAGAAAIAHGPFGDVGPAYATGYNCAFTDLAAGVTVLSHNSKGPNALALELGSGRAVAFADEELFSSLAVPDCASALFVPGTPNQRLALNAFAFLAGAGP